MWCSVCFSAISLAIILAAIASSGVTVAPTSGQADQSLQTNMKSITADPPAHFHNQTWKLMVIYMMIFFLSGLGACNWFWFTCEAPGFLGALNSIRKLYCRHSALQVYQHFKPNKKYNNCKKPYYLKKNPDCFLFAPLQVHGVQRLQTSAVPVF